LKVSCLDKMCTNGKGGKGKGLHPIGETVSEPIRSKEKKRRNGWGKWGGTRMASLAGDVGKHSFWEADTTPRSGRGRI